MGHIEMDFVPVVLEGAQKLGVFCECLLVRDVVVEDDNSGRMLCELANFIESWGDVDEEHQGIFDARPPHSIVMAAGDELALSLPGFPGRPGSPESVGAGRMINTDSSHGGSLTDQGFQCAGGEEKAQPKRLVSQSIMSRLSSSGFSCWVQCPHCEIMIVSKSSHRLGMSAASAG